MTNPITHDGYEQREMSATEYAEWKALCVEVKAETEAAKQAAAAAIAAKASAKAKLAALGLTDDEIAALVGN